MTTNAGRRNLPDGSFIQWYRIERLLGVGGFGVTYLATDTNLDRLVAIKEFFPVKEVVRAADGSLQAESLDHQARYQQGLQRFLTEARTLVKFAHPAIVRVFSVFEANATAYLVMEYEAGDDLKTHLAEPGRKTESYLANMFLQIASGLEQVHERGYIHRDIKPSNLIVRADGSPVLLDFGSTRPADQGTHTSYVSGGYTPLEQVQQGMSVGPWTDIYSLGATLYFAIAGVPPATSTSRLAALARGARDPYVSAHEVGGDHYTPGFLHAIDAALAFRDSDRPQSLTQWAQLFDDVGAASAQQPQRPPDVPQARAVVVTGRLQSLSGKQRIALGALLVVVVAGLLGWGFQAHRQQRQQALLQQAESGFASGEYADVALPLYREILQHNPSHPLASARIRQIRQLQESLIRRLMAQRRFSAVDRAIDAYARSDGDAASVRAFRDTLADVQRQAEIDSEFEAVMMLLKASRFQQAVSQLQSLQQRVPDDERLVGLLANARAGVERTSAAANRRPLSAPQTPTVQERIAFSEQQRRIAAANLRQRARRAEYDLTIEKVEQALLGGELREARRQLSIASAYQIDDGSLQRARQFLEREEGYQRKPFTAAEINVAKQRFESLRLAIEQKNSGAIERLTADTAGSRRRLFERLLRQYSHVEVRLTRFTTSVAPKSARSTLEIVALTLPNGDIVYPSDSYRSTALELRRFSDRWEDIRW